jgi:hypothetical protein
MMKTIMILMMCTVVAACAVTPNADPGKLEGESTQGLRTCEDCTPTGCVYYTCDDTGNPTGGGGGGGGCSGPSCGGITTCNLSCEPSIFGGTDIGGCDTGCGNLAYCPAYTSQEFAFCNANPDGQYASGKFCFGRLPHWTKQCLIGDAG